MADGSDLERTEAPTPKRQEEARKEGRIARSPELATAVMLLAGSWTLNAAAGTVAPDLGATFAGGLRAFDQSVDGAALVPMLEQAMRTAAVPAAMLAAGVAASTVAIGAAQARGILTWSPLSPQWERLNPIENARRLVGVTSIAELVKAFLKFGIIGWTAWQVLRTAWPDVADLSYRGPVDLLLTVRRLGVGLLRNAGLAYLAFAVLDYAWQWWRHYQGMRMTREEVREEVKRSEGDPMLKARIRSLARQRMRRRMLHDVAKADVVVVNPTHVAVALRYDPLAAPAPIVLAMGERLVAQRIRDIATAAGVPIVQNKPLARALLATAQVGSVIPAELYAAVAEVLAYVFRTRRAPGTVS